MTHPRHLLRRYLPGIALAVAVAAPLQAAHAAIVSPWKLDPARSGLWNFVQKSCIEPAQNGKKPDKDCVEVNLGKGYVIIKAENGKAHFQTIPTKQITGIEDSLLWVVDGTNYWKIALAGRDFVEKALSPNFHFHESQYGTAVNSIFIRSQDQLHIHMDCVDPAVTKVLKEWKGKLSTTQWTTLPELKGAVYRARLFDDATLAHTDPFRWLANEILPDDSMLPESIFITDTTLPDGKPGLMMLNDRASKEAQHSENTPGAQRGAAEFLLDHDCTVANGHL